jgi:uncharacterized protein
MQDPSEAPEPPDMRALVQAIRDQYLLRWQGTHGVGHWARVYTIGAELASGTGADADVLRLFAVFHDACRHSEGFDDGHGPRGAELALRFRGRYFDLDDGPFALLYEACAGHTIGRWHPDLTVQACWDSDRLDLLRCGISPDPARLGSDRARRLVDWASGRARRGTVPGFVDDQWATLQRPGRPADPHARPRRPARR